MNKVKSPQTAFLRKYYPAAMAAQRAYGIPAGMLLALAAHESGWGRSMLAMQHHNFFGVKSRSTAGALMPTKEYLRNEWQTVNARFETYATPEQSFMRAAQILSRSPYYTRARRRLIRNDVAGFIREVSSVWATDPMHADKVLHIMNSYDLWKPEWLQEREENSGVSVREENGTESREEKGD